MMCQIWFLLCCLEIHFNICFILLPSVLLRVTLYLGVNTVSLSVADNEIMQLTPVEFQNISLIWHMHVIFKM